jgi:L-lysine 2,3-aminomutase
MVMSASTLRSYIEPLISSTDPRNLETIRIETKFLAWWPYKYISDPGSKEILELFPQVVGSGRQLALQAHFSHPRELEHPAAQEAVRLIRTTGAQIVCQGPLIKHANNDPAVWRDLWNLQTKLGTIPYHMFVERDMGASHCSSVPLESALRIFSEAYSGLSGTARTVKGPSMSASPGKVGIIGDEAIVGEQVFALKFFQARNPDWISRVFCARYDPHATWLEWPEACFWGKGFFL